MSTQPTSNPGNVAANAPLEAPNPLVASASPRTPEPTFPRNLVPPTAVFYRLPRRRTAFEPGQLAVMEFRAAVELFLEGIRHRLRERTLYGYRLGADFLGRHFGGMKLDRIHIGHILAYQHDRSENAGDRWSQPAGPSIINHEITLLQMLMKAANLWYSIADQYKPLELPAWGAPKTMTEVEKRRFFAVAASRPHFELVLLIATITNQTSCAGTELRHIQLRDLDLEGSLPTVTINGTTAKNNHRGRTNPLTPVALDAFRKCLERARACGSVKPEHYLFPKTLVRNRWDPTQPASSSWIKRDFMEMREAAGLPWLTPHCLRHQCLTELGERGAAPEVIRQFAGHTTQKMLDHYCRVRKEEQARQIAVLSLDVSGASPVPKQATRLPVMCSCPHCGIPCAPGLAFCPNGDILDQEKARVARPWLFRGDVGGHTAVA